MVCGSPETVLREIRAYAATGVGQMITAFPIDVEDRTMLKSSFRMFREHIMPQIKVQ